MAQLPGFAAEEVRKRLRITVSEHPGVFAGEVLLQEGVVAADGERGLSHVHAVAPQELAEARAERVRFHGSFGGFRRVDKR